MRIADADLQKLLIDSGQVKAKVLEGALASRKDPHESLATVVIKAKLISEPDLLKLYAKRIGIPFAALSKVKIPREVLTKLPERIARKYQAVVFGFEENQYQLAVADPENSEAVDFMVKQVGAPVKIYLGLAADIEAAINQYTAAPPPEPAKAIKDAAPVPTKPPPSTKSSAENSAIAKTVNVVLEYAIKSGASDIHIEPRENFVQVRYRIDGVLRESMTLPRPILPDVVARIKTLAELKTDERRLPQDGRFRFTMGERTAALRVSTLPVMDGEKIVMRILDESTHALTLQQLGLGGYSLSVITGNLHKPHGLTLVTGPTGSGKSTTLYSILSMLNTPGVNISTIEDPVEYRIPGINQTQVNPKAGMTFAAGLRAFAQQDPNIILVGEIRDGETAGLAVQASLTGHVVLSTLHTGTAVATLARLVDLGIEPFLLASTFNTIISQRLVRKLCPKCRVPFTPNEHELETIRRDFPVNDALKYFHQLSQSGGQTAPMPSGEATPMVVTESLDEHRKDKVLEPLEEIDRKTILDRIAADPNIINRSSADAGLTLKPATPLAVTAPPPSPTNLSPDQFLIYKAGAGCDHCGGVGYSGRTGIYEVLANAPMITKMIVARANGDDIEAAAVHGGMLTLKQDGFVKVLMGLTTMEEVLRAIRE